MEQPAPARDPLLDLLRSWAITHVILFHVLHGIMRFAPQGDIPRIIADYPWWMNFSWQPLGVDVIFLVSSYLLTRSLLTERQTNGHINLKSYFVRRVSRIIPLYYVAVILFALIQQDNIGDIALALLFVEFLITGSAIVPVGWSMELMMLVYIALPATVWALTSVKRPLMWISLAITASLAVRLIPLWGQPEVATTLFTHLLDGGDVMDAADDLYFKPWYRLTPFLMGIGLAALLHLRPAVFANLSAKRPWLYIAATALIIFALFLPVHDASSWIYAATGPRFWMIYWATNGGLFALAAALIIIAGHGHPLRIKGPWAMISRNIMGVYLFHMPMILIGAVVVFRSTDEAALGGATVFHVIGIFVVALILSLGIAALLNRFVEGPTQTALRRKFGV